MVRKLIYNGHILTMDHCQEEAKNLLIEGERIVAINLDETEGGILGDDVEKIDLQGKTCLPGFHDSHMHMIEYGYNHKYCVDLSDAKSVDEIISKMRQFIKEKEIPEDSWVLGMRWNQENFNEKRLLTKEDLDKVSDKHFIFTKRVCIHIAAANSKLLELCGITADAYKENGDIGRYSNGQPDGRIYEDAISRIVLKKKPPLSIEEIEKIILDTAVEIKDKGFTAVQSDDMKAFSDFASKANILKAYDNLRNKGQLPIRIFEQLQVTSLEEFKEIVRLSEGIKSDENFSLGRLKLILDGSLGAGTAAMSKPYKGTADNFGILNFSDHELDEIVRYCYEKHLQVMCHGIGDRAIQQAIDVMAKYQKIYGDDRRPRLVHCQICRKKQVEQLAQSNIMADIQPAFVPTDYNLVEKKIDDDGSYAFYPWKTMLNTGIHISASSDSPVESYDAMEGVQAAVTRATFDGHPQGGWLPKEKLTVTEALNLYTTAPAYSVFKEREMGKIKEGYFADLVVLNQNPKDFPEEKLHQIRAVQTICRGK